MWTLVAWGMASLVEGRERNDMSYFKISVHMFIGFVVGFLAASALVFFLLNWGYP